MDRLPIVGTSLSTALGGRQIVGKGSRSAAKHQSSGCLWFTGLSGSGKSTIAELLEIALHSRGHHTYILDGDCLRSGLCSDLGFSHIDRLEQSRRVREVARLMVDAGLIVIVATISPFQAERAKARSCFEKGEFLEVYINTPLTVCELRDVKGLYAKARKNEITAFTGISSPYEPPLSADIVLDCDTLTPPESVERLMNAIERRRFIR